MGTGIFISYRRSDLMDAAGRLADRLGDEFGMEFIFLDIQSIGHGVDFRQRIDETLEQVDVVLALIGPRWDPPRLDEDSDYVRLELVRGLTLGKTLVPLLFHGSTMPNPGQLPSDLQPLAYLNAMPIRSDRGFREDVAHLTEFLIPRMERSLAGRLPQLATADEYKDRGYQRFSFAKDFAGAEHDYTEALRLGSEPDWWIYRERGAARLRLGKLDLAIADFRESLKLRPDAEHTLIPLLGALAELGDHDGAAEVWTQLQAIDGKRTGGQRYYLGRYRTSSDT